MVNQRLDALECSVAAVKGRRAQVLRFASLTREGAKMVHEVQPIVQRGAFGARVQREQGNPTTKYRQLRPLQCEGQAATRQLNLPLGGRLVRRAQGLLGKALQIRLRQRQQIRGRLPVVAWVQIIAHMGQQIAFGERAHCPACRLEPTHNRLQRRSIGVLEHKRVDEPRERDIGDLHTMPIRALARASYLRDTNHGAGRPARGRILP
jgi:hypothetical protein